MSVLVSAIMPTADRHKFATEAIGYFLAQTWPRKELIIIDDGAVPLRPDHHESIRYYRFQPLNLSVGLKRNIACELAKGQYIMHWDDDDIYSSDRMEFQVNALRKSGARIVGNRSMRFQTPEGNMWRYVGTPNYAIGVSLCYEKAYWETNPFDCVRVGEDNSFVMKARNNIHVLDDDERILARIHAKNTSPKSASYMEKQKMWERIG